MRAILYLMIAAILWGINFHFAKIMLQEVRFIEAGFWRYIFGVSPLLFLAYKSGLPSWSSIKKNLKGLVLVGIICLFGFNVLFFTGLNYSSAINGALIVSTTPMLTLVFSSIILKTRLKKNHIIGVLISLVGVGYLILKGDYSSLSNIDYSIGDIMLLFAATLFALQNVWVKKYSGVLSNINFTFLTNLLCWLSFALFLPFAGVENVTSYSSAFWLSALGIGVFGTSIAYYFWNEGIELSSANQAGVMINVIPLSTAIVSVILGEHLFLYHLFSAILILLGVILVRMR